MKAIMQAGFICAMLTAVPVQAGTPENTDASIHTAQTQAVRDADSWDSVGDQSGAAARTVKAYRSQAVPRAPEGIQARKAEMVRRMFWIMLAHR